MIVLGIETSCDETAAAIVDGGRTIRSNIVLSQLKEHEAFGGVVPEVAARAHLDNMDKVIRAALHDAGATFADLDGVAATCGPGLIGGVMVGMMAGKAIASARHIPFLAVNHLEAHALTPRLTHDIAFPYLLLLVSGGHTQILVAEDVGRYRRWGATVDDAAGECFDKAAKLLGLPYPGGPNLERAADACAKPEKALLDFPLPRPMKGRKDCNFSFSGLKTAVRAHAEKHGAAMADPQMRAALAYAAQTAIADILAERCGLALAKFRREYPSGDTFVVSGGVAANRAVRAALEKLSTAGGMRFVAPPLNLCSDNGAMIAWTGIEKLKRNMTDPLSVPARPRWPLDPQAEPVAGAGVKA